MGARNQVGIGLSYQPATEVDIIDSCAPLSLEIPPAYVAVMAGRYENSIPTRVSPQSLFIKSSIGTFKILTIFKRYKTRITVKLLNPAGLDLPRSTTDGPALKISV